MAGFVIGTGAKVLGQVIKALPTIGLTGTAVGLGGAGVGRIGSALGLTKTNEEVAEDRGYNLNKDTVEKTNKLGDWYRDFATGTNTSEINDLAETNAIDQVNQDTSTVRGDLVQRSSQLNGNFTDEGLKRQAGETLEELRARLVRASGKMDITEKIKLNPGVDTNRLGSNPSMAAVDAEIRRTDPTSDTNTLTRLEKQRLDGIKYQADLLDYQERSAAADRALTREINANNRRENIQLRMMDSSDRRADRRSADLRADRKERQMLILQMIKGLQQGVSSI